MAALVCVSWACAGPVNEAKKNAATIEKEEQADRLIERGKAFAAMGDTTRAEQYFATALEHGADEVKLLPLLLETCVRDGRFEMAIEYAKPYVQKHPNDMRTRYVLGTLYSAVGNNRDAKEEVEAVVKAKPNDADPHYLLGLLRKGDSDWVGADAQFREYLRLAPKGEHSEEARASLLRDMPQVAHETDAGAQSVPQLIGPPGPGMSQSITDGG